MLPLADAEVCQSCRPRSSGLFLCDTSITMRGPWPLFLDGPDPSQSPVPTCYNARS